MQENKIPIFKIIFFPFYMFKYIFLSTRKLYAKIIYFVVVLTLFLSNYFIGGIYSMILLYALIIFPIISLLYTLILIESMKVETEVVINSDRLYNKSMTQYRIKIITPKFMPIMFNKFSFGINCDSKKIIHNFDVKMEHSLTHERNVKVYDLSFIHKGENTITLKKIYVTDIFDIKKFQKEKNIKSILKVYPRKIPINQYDLKPIMNEISMENSPIKGDQYYSIREYTKGDPLNKIHWKLTHKFNKDFSKTPDLLAKKTTIFYDNRIFKNCTKRELYQYEDNITEVLLSMIDKYLANNHAVDVNCYSSSTDMETISISHGSFQDAYDKLSFLNFVPKPIINLSSISVNQSEEYILVSSVLDEKTYSFLNNIRQLNSKFIFYFVPTLKENYKASIEQIANMSVNFTVVLVDKYIKES